jgi:hypothetical protein
MKTNFRNKTILTVLSFVAFGAVSASAMGYGQIGMGALNADEAASRHATMFEAQAKILGIPSSEIKDAWANGKDLKTLAQEKGISEATLQEKMKAMRIEQMKTQLAALVSKGVITQAQADKRLVTMANIESKGKSGGKGRHGKGFGI